MSPQLPLASQFETTPASRTFASPVRRRTLLAACALLGGFFAGAHAGFAQEVTTVPVGAMTADLNAGYSLIGLPLLRPAAATGSIASNTLSVITPASPVSVIESLTAGERFYIEITSGAFEGDRFEIDVTTSRSLNNGTITIANNTETNTRSLTVNDLTDSHFTIRQHASLEYISTLFNPALTGNNSSGSADQIILYNETLGAFDTYFLRGDGQTWRKLGESTDVRKSAVAAPGVGFFVKRVSANTQLTQIGEVRTNNFILPLKPGLQMRSSPYPVNYSPTLLGASASNGWTGNNSSGSADQLITFDPTLNAYVTHFLRLDGTTWRKLGESTDVKNNDILQAGAGFWISRATTDIDYILVRPFSL